MKLIKINCTNKSIIHSTPQLINLNPYKTRVINELKAKIEAARQAIPSSNK